MRFPFSATTLSASKTLTMEEFGSPDKVLKMKEDKPPSCDMLGENEVLINILAVRSAAHVLPHCLSVNLPNAPFSRSMP